MNTEEKIEVMQAYLNGKKIQVKGKRDDTWEDYNHKSEPDWDWFRCDYRIKPELKLRPYKDFMEMAKDAVKHGVDGDTFMIEDKNKKCIGTVSLVPDGVVKYYYSDLEDEFISFAELAEKYTWLDGTPCGVEEEV